MRLTTHQEAETDEATAVEQGKLILHAFGFNPDENESPEDSMNKLLSAIGGIQENVAHSSAPISNEAELNDTLNPPVDTK